MLSPASCSLQVEAEAAAELDLMLSALDSMFIEYSTMLEAYHEQSSIRAQQPPGVLGGRRRGQGGNTSGYEVQ